VLIPLFVELCAGTAALSLRLHAGRYARPPVSRMGAKTGYGGAILAAMGFRAGQGAARYLWCDPDPGVRLLLEAYRDAGLAREAASIIRGWKDEDPRALWERLRAEGPPVLEPWITGGEVARRVLLGAWAFRGGHPESGFNPCAVYPREMSATDHGSKGRTVETPAGVLDTVPTLPATIHPDARAVDPREVARWALLGQWSFRRGEPASGYNAGLLSDRDPTPTGGHAAKARTCDQEAGLWDGLPTLEDAAIADDARAIDPPRLPPGTVCYIDPPYQGTTGYASDLTRAEVLSLARRWADAGAAVYISEAEPLTELHGWHYVDITTARVGQKRTFSRQQAEWLTCSVPPALKPGVQMGLF